MWFLTLVIGLILGYVFSDKIGLAVRFIFKRNGGCCSG